MKLKIIMNLAIYLVEIIKYGSGNINENPNKLLKVGDKVDFNADSFTRNYGSFSPSGI